MRKKIIVFLLMSVILVSSLLVSASASNIAYYRNVLPLTLEWDIDPDPSSTILYEVPVSPTTLNHDRTSYSYTLQGTRFLFTYPLYSEYTSIFSFVTYASSFHTSNVNFYAPYGFGSPESFYDVSFTDLSALSEYDTVSYSYYITSNDADTRVLGERVEVVVELDSLVDYTVYPFRSLMTFYGGADVIFISDFSLSFSSELSNWTPEIYVYNYYEDYDWSFFNVTEIMEDRLSADPDLIYNEGYDVGISDGYDIGYVDGFEDGLGGISFTSWIGDALSGFFDNFSFDGFNLGIVFFVLLSILLILAVVKMFS